MGKNIANNKLGVRAAILAGIVNASFKAKKAREVIKLKDHKGKVRKVFKYLPVTYISATIPGAPLLDNPSKGVIVVPHTVADKMIKLAKQSRSKYIPNR